MPFSYLDLYLNANTVTGALVVHDFDASYELGLLSQDMLLDSAAVERYRPELIEILSPRLSLRLDEQMAAITWGRIETMPERQSLKIAFSVAGTRPARIHINAQLFPYDHEHQTFINVYEDGALKHQAIVDVGHQGADYYSGSAQGRAAVIKTFVMSGIEHILVGPDHILFLVGLLLLGGTLLRLAGIVTAFTVGHSITLSLAALDLFSPSTRLVEPLIALTIVIVGADNLMVLRKRQDSDARGTDIRAWLAAGFGLIHGFGFASVLKEFGLPQSALGWSLFAFNLGVEMGQLLIVGVVAGSLAMLALRSALWSSRVSWAGSIAVILAGLYWFVERVFFPGGFL